MVVPSTSPSDSPSAVPPSPDDAAQPRRWLLSETRRAAVSAAAAALVTFAVEFIWLSREPELRAHGWAVGCVLAWGFFAAIHSVLTHRAYRDATGIEFLADDAEATPERPTTRRARVWNWFRQWWRGWWVMGNDAPSWSVQVSVLALIVVALIMVTPVLRSSQGLLVAALAMVAASWANVAVMYAVHYARIDARDGGLGFPGDEPRAFVDYLYLALAVQTTFGTTDVEIRTRQLRRTAIGHGALAFVFNSVIIAMIISLLLGVAGGS